MGMMRIFNKLFTRRRDQPHFSELPTRVRQRLALACRELSKEEEAVAARLDLPHPPRLLMVDEEEAVILTQNDRAKIS
jgi:hypothetical protein